VLNEQNAQLPRGRSGRRLPAARRGASSTPSPPKGGWPTAEFENIIVRANPDGSTLRLKDVRARGARLERLRIHRPRQRQEAVLVACSCSPAPTRSKFERASRTSYEPPLPASLTAWLILRAVRRRASWKYLSAKWSRHSPSDGARISRRLRLPAELARHPHPVRRGPVSLIGLLRGLYLLAISINTLTLFGMVLADRDRGRRRHRRAGERRAHMRRGTSGCARSGGQGDEEVTSPIIAIVLVLVRGIRADRVSRRPRGRSSKRQFAVTISIAW